MIEYALVIFGLTLGLLTVKLFDWIVYKVKTYRNRRREKKLGKMPDEVATAKELLQLGIGGSDHWNIIANAAKKYPEWFK